MATITRSVRRRIAGAFQKLNARGIRARTNFQCCQTCGVAAMYGESPPDIQGFAFYHEQDADGFRSNGDLKPNDYVCITFGGFLDDAVKIGQRVAAALRDEGLTVDWVGTDAKRIAVTGVTT